VRERLRRSRLAARSAPASWSTIPKAPAAVSAARVRGARQQQAV